MPDQSSASESATLVSQRSDATVPPASAPRREISTRYPAWLGPALAVGVFAALAPLGYTLRLGIVTTLTTMLLYMLVAHGWNLLGGYGGYLNFGVALFSGAGVYTAAILNNHGWSMWQTLLPSAASAVLVAIPVGLATLRLRGHYFAIFTLVLTFLAQIVVRNSPWLGGSLGMYTFIEASSPRQLAATFYYSLLALAAAATLVGYLVERSNLGSALRAIREDEDAAAILGVRTVDVKMRAFLSGAALAGLGGGVYAYLTGYIEPNGSFDLSFSLDIVLVCVLGGLGTWQGPLIGAAIVVLLEQWLRTAIPDLAHIGLAVPPESNRVVLGLLLILVALFARQGVAGLLRGNKGRPSYPFPGRIKKGATQ